MRNIILVTILLIFGCDTTGTKRGIHKESDPKKTERPVKEDCEKSLFFLNKSKDEDCHKTSMKKAVSKNINCSSISKSKLNWGGFNWTYSVIDDLNNDTFRLNQYYQDTSRAFGSIESAFEGVLITSDSANRVDGYVKIYEYELSSKLEVTYNQLLRIDGIGEYLPCEPSQKKFSSIHDKDVKVYMSISESEMKRHISLTISFPGGYDVIQLQDLPNGTYLRYEMNYDV